MSSPITNWHVIIAAIIVTIVTVVALLLKAPVEAIGTIDALVLGVLAHAGLLQAADTQTVQKIADGVAPQIATEVQAVEKTLTDLHTVSTANVAALHTAVAVQAAKSGFVLPPALKVPEPVQAVEDSIQNKPVTL